MQLGAGFTLVPEWDKDKDFQMWEGLLSHGAYPDLTLRQLKTTWFTSIFRPWNVTRPLLARDTLMIDLNLEAIIS